MNSFLSLENLHYYMKYSSSSNDMDYGLEIRNNQRAFTSTCAKNSVHFSIFFSILHIYFSKYPTSDYLFYTTLH